MVVMQRLLSVLVFLLLAVLPAAAQDDASPLDVPVIGGDEEALRELLGRMASPVYGWPGVRGEPRVYVGQLPEDVPEDLPLPADAEVIGALVNAPAGLSLILDVAGSPDEVMAFYREALDEGGWRSLESLNRGSGFVPAVEPTASQLQYCSDDDRLLQVLAVQAAEQNVDVRVQYQVSPEYSPCSPQFSPDPNRGVIPTLVAPPGVELRGGGSSGGGPNAEQTVSAVLVGEPGPAELVEHYNAQLEDTGWTMQDTGGIESAAWSTWTFEYEDSTWGGTLLVINSPASEQGRLAYLFVARADDR